MDVPTKGERGKEYRVQDTTSHEHSYRGELKGGRMREGERSSLFSDQWVWVGVPTLSFLLSSRTSSPPSFLPSFVTSSPFFPSICSFFLFSLSTRPSFSLYTSFLHSFLPSFLPFLFLPSFLSSFSSSFLVHLDNSKPHPRCFRK